MSRQPFSVEALREVLSFDPETGHFHWLHPESPRVKIGDRAGTVAKNGRREIHVLRRRCFAHHLAWFYHYGEWPTDYVRQRNGDYDDCRIENLYRQSPAEAGLTKRLPSSNTSGFRGVSFDKRRGKWQASIRRKYKQMHLGLFDTAEEAHEAFQRADEAFRPDVSPEQMEAVASDLGIRRRRKALWAVTLREANNVTGWVDENAFWQDIGEVPGSRYSVIPLDGSRPIGPGNWQWVLPRHAQFAMDTPEGRRAYEKHRRSVNPSRFRGGDLRKTFGISLSEYQAMHDAQDGKCAICGEAETVTRDGKIRWLSVDHDHKDGHIRELLCGRCNVGIGSFLDNPDRLRAAAEYLERHANNTDSARNPG